MISGAKTIAEYAIRKWMEDNHFIASEFQLTMDGNEGTITDKNNESLIVAYDKESKSVYEVDYIKQVKR